MGAKGDGANAALELLICSPWGMQSAPKQRASGSEAFPANTMIARIVEPKTQIRDNRQILRSVNLRVVFSEEQSRIYPVEANLHLAR